jgi:hypothetical protein
MEVIRLYVCIRYQNQNAGQNHNIKLDNKFFLKGGTVQVFGNNPNKSKFHSGRN